MQSSVPILSMHSFWKISASKHYWKEEEEAEEAKRVDQMTRKHLHEQLAEQEQMEMAQIAEQETARQLISEALQ